MKRTIGLFVRGIAFGWALGICLAGAVSFLRWDLQKAGTPAPGAVTFYFFAVGSVLGLMGGWCLSLRMVLGLLLESLFVQVSQWIPLEGGEVGAAWAGKMEVFFRKVLGPLPRLFVKFLDPLLTARFRNVAQANQILRKVRKKNPSATAQALSFAALGYFLEPLWALFWAAYAILFLAACVFWSFPFFRG